MAPAVSTIGPTVTSTVVSSMMMGGMRIAVAKAAVGSPKTRVSRRRWRRSSGSQEGQNGYKYANSKSQRAIAAFGGRREVKPQHYPDEQYQGQ